MRIAAAAAADAAEAPRRRAPANDFAKHLRQKLAPRARGTEQPDVTPSDPLAETPAQPEPTAHPELGGALLAIVENVAACKPAAAAAVTATAPENPEAPPVQPEVPEVARPAALDPEPPKRPLTPLEEAVHALLARIASDDHAPARIASDDHAPATRATTVATPSLTAPVAPQVRDAVPRPQPARDPAPAGPPELHRPDDAPLPSHVRLVLEDAGERVVVTVAVRGAEVNVALRASDDHLAASLARNAASLDHALRARGLELDHLSSEREPPGRERPPQPDRHRDDDDTEPFELEEHA